MVKISKKTKYCVGAYLIYVFYLCCICMVFIYRPPPEKESSQQSYARIHADFVAYQKRNIFKYINFVIHEISPEYTPYLGNVIGEERGEYYWNSWNAQKLVPVSVGYEKSGDEVVVKFKSADKDGYLIFAQSALIDAMIYCGWGGVHRARDQYVKVIEFRKDEHDVVREYAVHNLGYSRAPYEKDCETFTGEFWQIQFPEEKTLFERLLSYLF